MFKQHVIGSGLTHNCKAWLFEFKLKTDSLARVSPIEFRRASLPSFCLGSLVCVGLSLFCVQPKGLPQGRCEWGLSLQFKLPCADLSPAKVESGYVFSLNSNRHTL